MPRVLFFCTGNTCRSPLAEVFARDLMAPSVLTFDSAGLQVTGRHPASEGSLKVASQLGIDLRGHLSKGISADLLNDCLWAVGMTRSHAAVFRSRSRGWFLGKLGILGAPGVDLMLEPGSPVCEEVDDPYGGNWDTYQSTGLQIRQLVQQWAPVFAEDLI